MPDSDCCGRICTLEGRALSTTGAVSVYGTLAYIPIGCGSAILTGPITPVLGTAACYGLFSSNGAVSNSGITNVTGDVGSNNGSTTGFDPLLVTGRIHPNPDILTAQCAYDFQNAYTYLDTIPYDIELLYPAQFGNKLVLTSHTYRMNAAATFTDTLYLDAEGNADAVFVIQINGALTTSTYSTVRLINGTQARNVYWRVTGAVIIDNNSVFCGMIASNGAVTLNTDVTLNGRALTKSGIINTTAITTNTFSTGGCYVLPVKLLSFTGACDKHTVVLKWSTSSEISNDYYSIERSTDRNNWQLVGVIKPAVNSSARKNYSFTDKEPYNVASYYRLKQTDIDGQFTYFKIVVINNCKEDLTQLNIYPNPAIGIFNLFFNGNKEQFQSVSIYNVSGEKVYSSAAYQSTIDISGNPNGMYFLHFNLVSKTIIKKMMIKKP